MIDFNEAERKVLEAAVDFGVEDISLSLGIGRVLRESWHCDRDMPPYHRVTMDGIAFNFEGVRDLDIIPVEHIVAAGDSEYKLKDSGNCVEIMTGAVLPKGADTVVRYEDVEIHDNTAKIIVPFKLGQNIHRKGEDRKQGDLLLTPNTLLSSAEIGVGASIGKSQIKVSQFPKAIIISTGNELVEIDEIPAPHQIRRGNIYRTASTLNNLGMTAETAHLVDDLEIIKAKLKSYLKEFDVIILSGGVSKGKFDFLPEALESCGVKKHFHKVAQRPGKPFWFGTHPDGATVFALPGNPVSSFMCLHIYLVQWLQSSLGLSLSKRPSAILNADVIFKPDLTYFLEVSIDYDDNGSIIATPQKGNGSGDMANLMNADAFMKLPRGRDLFKKGEVFEIYRYR